MSRLLLALPLLAPAAAAAAGGEWRLVSPPVTSADLAASGWALITTDGLSWPDGRQALVSFWADPEDGSVLRCVDSFDAAMQSTGGACHAPEPRP